MTEISSEVSTRINTYAGNYTAKSNIRDFIIMAQEADECVEFAPGNERWKAIDIWYKGHRVGIIFPGSGLIKFFERSGKKDFQGGILNNRREWVFDANKSLSTDSAIRCLQVNVSGLTSKGIGSNRNISPRVRFAVFVRDNYKCQYCGRKGPEVSLHVDHKTPASLGGSNDMDNLVTACSECNLGKSNRFTT